MTKKTDANKELSAWITAWEREIAKTPYVAEKIRSEEDAADFWGKSASTYTYARLPEAVGKVLEVIKQEGLFDAGKDILDVGCGPGNYALPFAERGMMVVALDGSEGMLTVLKKSMQNAGLKNIQTLQALWENVDLQAENMENAFHLVFASLTPAINNYDTLIKLNRASQKYCCLVTWAGVPFDREKEELWPLVMGKEKPYGKGFDAIYPFNILYALGCRPVLRYVEIINELKINAEEAIENLSRHFWLYTELTPSIRERITEYVWQKVVDGFYCQKKEEVLGVLMWQPNK